MAGDLRQVICSELLNVWSSGHLRPWHVAGSDGSFWWPLRFGQRPPRRWEDAAEAHEALGVAYGEDRSTLHAASLGMQPLYTRQVGEGLFFSTRIGDLAELLPGPLDPDWVAWASIFTLGAPMSDRTPFQQIRRMPGGAAWHFDRGVGRLRYTRTSPSVGATTRAPARPAEVAELANAAVERAQSDTLTVRSLLAWRRRRHRTSPAITLSGGWDSRLLAGCAVDHHGGTRLTGYTTSPDDGIELDLDLSGPVAENLGLAHEVLLPEADDWPAYARSTYRRVEHQTYLHVWLEPLAATLRSSSHSSLLDGLAGGVLLNNAFIDENVVSARTSSDVAGALWSKLASTIRAGTPGTDGGVLADVVAEVRKEFDAEVHRLDGHPAQARLSILLTRTSRCISLSPMCLFAPELDVKTPFLDLDLMDASLSLPLEAKSGGEYYRQVLTAVDPTLAILPSTNDKRPAGRSRLPQRSTSEAARTWAADVIDQLTTRDVLDPTDELDPHQLLRTWNGKTWLFRLVAFGDWILTHEDKLSQTRPPWSA